MVIVAGDIFDAQSAQFFEGYVEMENGIIVHAGRGAPPKAPDMRGTVLPLFFNWHTHVADIIARERIQKSGRKWTIEELVGPGGEKHRILEETRDAELVSAMCQAMWEMAHNGIGGFCDFREGGLHGAYLLNSALAGQKIGCMRMARPAKNAYDRAELDAILKISDGIGASAISDWDYSELKKVARHAKSEGKKFAIHASERVREDIGLVLDLKPDAIVHMTQGTDRDFAAVADAGLLVVVCPSSSKFFGMRPPVDKMLAAGVNVKLGTDNAMIASLDMFEEARALRSISSVNLIDSLRMCLSPTGNIFNGKNYSRSLSEGAPPEFMVLKGAVSSAGSKDVIGVFLGKYSGRR
ncbi:MAG: deaminase [Thermoplasmata archaeon HGW-Thermoplasmata-2]|nr:MAG: deaminase [Thermoplasmata archaeon HGW-Thermoplasmata-2]